MSKLSPKMKWVWLFRNILFSLILYAGIIVGIILIKDNRALALSILISVTTPLILLLYIWPFLSYSRYYFTYDDMRITICHGVIFKHTITIPVRQIQDLHLFEGPVMTILKLKGITISTGGSNHDISGLDSIIADSLVKKLEENLNKRLDSEV